MTINDVRQLAPDVLRKRIQEQRVALRTLLFSARQKQLKNVRDIRRVRKEIAQMMSASQQMVSAVDQKIAS